MAHHHHHHVVGAGASVGGDEASLHTFRQTAGSASARRPHHFDQKEATSGSLASSSLMRQFALLQTQGELLTGGGARGPPQQRQGVWQSEGSVILASAGPGAFSARKHAARTRTPAPATAIAHAGPPLPLLPPVVGAAPAPPNLMAWVKSLARLDAARSAQDHHQAQLAAHQQHQLVSTFPSAEQLPLYYEAHQQALAEQRALADQQQQQAAARAAAAQPAENVTLSQTWGAGSTVKASTSNSTTPNMSRQASESHLVGASRQASQTQLTPHPPAGPAPYPPSHTSSRTSLLDASSRTALEASPSSDVLLVLKSKSLAQRQEEERERLAKETQHTQALASALEQEAEQASVAHEPEKKRQGRIIMLKPPQKAPLQQPTHSHSQSQQLAEQKTPESDGAEFGFLVGASQGALHQTLRPSAAEEASTEVPSFPHSSSSAAAAATEPTLQPLQSACESSRVNVDMDVLGSGASRSGGPKVALTLSAKGLVDLPHGKQLVLTLHRRVGNRAYVHSSEDEDAWEYFGCTEMLPVADDEPSLAFERTFMLDAPLLPATASAQPETSLDAALADGPDAALKALSRKQPRGLPLGLSSSSSSEAAQTILKIQALHVVAPAASLQTSELDPQDTHLMAQLSIDGSSSGVAQASVVGEALVLLEALVEAATAKKGPQAFRLQPAPLSHAQLATLRRKDAGRFGQASASAAAQAHTTSVSGSILVSAALVGLLQPVSLSLACLDLPPSDWMRKTDAVLVASVRNARGRYAWLGQTERQRACSQPIFEQALLVHAHSLADRKLRLAVYDSTLVPGAAAPHSHSLLHPPRHVRYQERDLLGEVFISLNELLEAQDAARAPPLAHTEQHVEDQQAPAPPAEFAELIEDRPALSFRLLKRGQLVRVGGKDSVLQVRAVRVPRAADESAGASATASVSASGEVVEVQLSVECTGLPLLATTGKCDPLVSLFAPLSPPPSSKADDTSSRGLTQWLVLAQTERLVHAASPSFRRVLRAPLRLLPADGDQQVEDGAGDLRLAVYDTHETDHVRYHSTGALCPGPQEYLLPEGRLLGEHLFDLRRLVHHAQILQAKGEPTAIHLDLARHGRVVLQRKTQSASDADAGRPAQFVVQVLNLAQLPPVMLEPEPVVEPQVVVATEADVAEAEVWPQEAEPEDPSLPPSQISLSLTCRGLPSSPAAQHTCVLSISPSPSTVSSASDSGESVFEALGQTELAAGEHALWAKSFLFAKGDLAPKGGEVAERQLQVSIFAAQSGADDGVEQRQLVGQVLVPLSSLLLHARQDLRLTSSDGRVLEALLSLHATEVGAVTRAFLSIAASGLPVPIADGLGGALPARAQVFVHQAALNGYTLVGRKETQTSRAPLFRQLVAIDLWPLQDRPLRLRLYQASSLSPAAAATTASTSEDGFIGECFVHLRQLQAQASVAVAALREYEASVAQAASSGEDAPPPRPEVHGGLFVQLSLADGETPLRPLAHTAPFTPSLADPAPSEPVAHASEVYLQLWTSEQEFIDSLTLPSPFSRTPSQRPLAGPPVSEEAWQALATFLAAPSTQLFDHLAEGVPITAHDLAALLQACRGSLPRLLDHVHRFNIAERRFDAPLRSMVPHIHLAAASDVHVGEHTIERVRGDLSMALFPSTPPTPLQVDRAIWEAKGVAALIEHLGLFASVRRRFTRFDDLLGAIASARQQESHVQPAVHKAVRAFVGHPCTRLFRAGSSAPADGFLEVAMLPAEVDECVIACDGSLRALLKHLHRFDKEGRAFTRLAQVAEAIRQLANPVESQEPPQSPTSPASPPDHSTPAEEAGAAAAEPAAAVAAPAPDSAESESAPAPAPVPVASMAGPPLEDTSDLPNVAWQTVFRFLTSPKTTLFPKISRGDSPTPASASATGGLHVSPKQIEQLLATSDGVQGLMSRLRQLNADGVQFKAFSELTAAMRDAPHRGRASEVERRVILGYLMASLSRLVGASALAAASNEQLDALLHAAGDLLTLIDLLDHLDAAATQPAASLSELTAAITALREKEEASKKALVSSALEVVDSSHLSAPLSVACSTGNFTASNPPRISDEVFEALIAHVTRPGLKLFAPSSQGLTPSRAVADKLIFTAGGLAPLLVHLDLFDVCARYLEGGFASLLPALLEVEASRTHLASTDVGLVLEALNTSHILPPTITPLQADQMPGDTLDALVVQAAGVPQLLAHVRSFSRVGRVFTTMTELLAAIKQSQQAEDGSHMSAEVRAALWAALYPAVPPAASVPLLPPGLLLDGAQLDELIVAGGGLDGALVDLALINYQVASAVELVEAMRRAREGLRRQQMGGVEVPKPADSEPATAEANAAMVSDASPVELATMIVVDAPVTSPEVSSDSASAPTAEVSPEAAQESTPSASTSAASAPDAAAAAVETASLASDALPVVELTAVEAPQSEVPSAAAPAAADLLTEAKEQLLSYFAQPSAQALFPLLASSSTPSDVVDALGVSDEALEQAVLLGGGSAATLLTHLVIFLSISRTFASWSALVDALREWVDIGSHVSEADRTRLLEYLGSEACELFELASAAGHTDMQIDSSGIDTLVASAHGLEATLQHLQILDACGRKVATFEELAPAVELALRTASHVLEADQAQWRSMLLASPLFSPPLTEEALALTGLEFDRFFACSAKRGLAGLADHLERFLLAGRTATFATTGDLLAALEPVAAGESHVSESARESLIEYLSSSADALFDASVSSELELLSEDLDTLVYAAGGAGLQGAIGHLQAFVAVGRTFAQFAALIAAVQAAARSHCHLAEADVRTIGQLLSADSSRLLAPALQSTLVVECAQLDALVLGAGGVSQLVTALQQLEASAPQAESLDQLVTLVQAATPQATNAA